MSAGRLRLASLDLSPGFARFDYEGRADLGEGRLLAFHVRGSLHADGRVEMTCDLGELEAASFEVGLRRLGDWLAAAAPVLGGVLVESLPLRVGPATSGDQDG